MNKSHIKGKWDEVKGKVKEELGHATGNAGTEIKGIAEQVKGKLEQKFGDVKDATKKGVDSVINNKGKKI